MAGRVTAAKVASLAAAGAFSAYLAWPSSSKKTTPAPLSSAHFTPALLTAAVPQPGRQPSKLLTLALAPHQLPHVVPSAIWSVYIKDSDLQIERPYTPLEGLSANGELKFWVKRYDDGEVSRWLCSRQPGDTLEIRGPVPTWSAPADAYDEVFLISGGTAITPFYQLLHSLFHDPDTASPGRTHYTLIHSSPSTSTLPPPALLDTLAAWARRYPRHLSLSLCVDARDMPDPDYGRIHEGRIGTAVLERALRRRGLLQSEAYPWRFWHRRRSSSPDHDRRRVLFLVCGPDPMIHAIAGPKGAPGVGGVLGQMGFREEHVRRL